MVESLTCRAMKTRLYKYNGHLAATLILVMIISVSLQLVHDGLLDHHHDIDCPMFVVDNGSGLSASQTGCTPKPQTVESTFFSPSAVLLRIIDKQPARAPPAVL